MWHERNMTNLPGRLLPSFEPDSVILHPFIFSTSSGTYAPGMSWTNNVSIYRDGDFICEGLIKTGSQPFMFWIRSSHNDRLWSNISLSSDIIPSDKPFLFPKPIHVFRASTISVDFTYPKWSYPSSKMKRPNSKQPFNEEVSLGFVGHSLLSQNY